MEERLALAKKANPHLLNTVKERQSQLVEASLFLSVMGDPETGVAPKKYKTSLFIGVVLLTLLTHRFVHVFFEEERLPLAEGWRRPTSATNTSSLTVIMDRLNKASQTKRPWIPSSLITCPWTRLQPEGPEVVWPPQL